METRQAWIRDSGIGAPVERGAMDGLDWAIITFPQTTIHHETRCLWRLVLFSRDGNPLFSLDLERDILGEFCLSLVSEGQHRILYRYGAAPSFETFRERSLREAAQVLARPKPPTRNGARSAGTKLRRH